LQNYLHNYCYRTEWSK